VNTLGIRRIMFAVDDIDDVVARLRSHGAELVGEIARYEDIYGCVSCVAPRASSSDWPRSSAEKFRLAPNRLASATGETNAVSARSGFVADASLVYVGENE